MWLGLHAHQDCARPSMQTRLSIVLGQPLSPAESRPSCIWQSVQMAMPVVALQPLGAAYSSSGFTVEADDERELRLARIGRITNFLSFMVRFSHSEGESVGIALVTCSRCCLPPQVACKAGWPALKPASQLSVGLPGPPFCR